MSGIRRPSDCPTCGIEFEKRTLLRSEVLSIVLREGPSAARAHADEALEEFHSEHYVPRLHASTGKGSAVPSD